MKRSLFANRLKKTMVAVSASSLMLGASHGGTVALNLVSYYYSAPLAYGVQWIPGQTPLGIGLGYGYQTTGWAVTATAFGVTPANWYSPWVPTSRSSNPYAVSTNAPIGPGGSISALCTAPLAWETGIGEQVNGWKHAQTVAPGNDQVTWSILESSGGTAPAVSLSGLAANFPNGYVVGTIAAANGAGKSFNGVEFTDGVNSSHADYNTIYYEANPGSDGADTGGTIALSDSSGIYTSDTFQINCDPPTTGSNSVLCGFIITDVPVVTRNVPSTVLLAVGASLVLPPPSVVGIGLTYQWQHAGTNLPGATFSTYTNNAVALTDSGLYQAVVSSTFFPSTSVTGQVANVTAVPPHAARVATWDANTATTGAQDGAGTWSNTLTNWWSGSFDDYWGNADSAVFGAGGTGAYTVTLNGNITANSITFSSGAYTITNISGQTLTLQGRPALGGNTNGTITVPVTITTNLLLKTGTGAVTLAGALTGTNVFVSAGTLQVQSKSGGDATYAVTNGATLKIGYSTGGGYANTAMQIYGSGAAATTGLYLKGGTTYNVSGGVVVNSAPTTIRQYGTGLAGIGIFDIHSTPGLSITAAASGSAIDPNIQIVNTGYGMVITTAAGTDTATGDLVINGPLNVTGSYGLITLGSGSIRLNAAGSTNNAELKVSGGSVICGVTNCVGTNALLVTAAAGVFDLNGTSQTVSNAVLAGTLKMTINRGGSPNCNTLNCWGVSVSGQPATFGGTLVVTNLGGPLALGDSFTLFPTPSGSGFATLMLPTVGNGLAWQDDSSIDGTIKVIAGSVPPSIVTDLSGSTNYAYVGGGYSFAITASGDPTLQYQWTVNGTVVGSNSPTLTLTGLTLASSGNYSCTVTNNFGVAQSQTNYLLVSNPNAYEAVVLNDAPTAFWPLDEADGTTAFDVFFNNNATYSGGYSLDYASNSVTGTQGAHFDGSTGKALTAYAPALNPAVFTAAAWVNPDLTPSSEYCVLSCGQFASTGRSGWLIYQFPTYWDVRTFYTNGTATAAEVVGTSIPTLGSWEHLAVSWDGTTARLYVNGVLEGSKVSTVTPKYVPGLSGGFCVGARADSSFYFPGTVSTAVLYSRALSAREISALAATGPPISTNPTNLTASVSSGNLNLAWPLDHTGWRLLVQTNHLTSGVSSNPNDWGTISGANSTNMVSIPITPSQTAEFYRLAFP